MTETNSEIEGLWNELHGELLGFVKQRVADSATADDIVQTAFLRAYGQIESGTQLRNPRSWLYQIVRNLVADTYRRENRRRETSGEAHSELTQAENDLPEVAEDVRQVMAAALPLFVDRLATPYREALQLTDLEGLTQAEAAKRAGISLSGMKSRVQRGRRMLLEALHQCCAFSVDARNRVIDWEMHESCDCD